MTVIIEKTFWARIYMAGDYSFAKNICKEYTMEEGLCVNMYPVDYIYTAGEESGFCVELINYPAYPVEKEEVYFKACDLGKKLIEGCFQSSFTIVMPDETVFVSRRKDIDSITKSKERLHPILQKKENNTI